MEKMEESTRELIQKYGRNSLRLLDAGVGLGRLLGPLTNYERYGTDINTNAIDKLTYKGVYD